MKLIQVSRTHPALLQMMKVHYSQPKGFVGRNICYLVSFDNSIYGGIVGGSATLHLPGRNEFLWCNKQSLNTIINNIFYHIEPINGRYPKRNFTIQALKQWRETISNDWQERYGDNVRGFESLVELPRTGELYKRDGWTEIGLTHGFTCKREGGIGTDNWTGKRVWDTKNLRPKRVFARWK